MTRLEDSVRLILWLSKRDWGLAFLLALVLLVTAIALPERVREPAFEGLAFRAGFYIGTLVLPDYTTRGTNAFYLVPLFGVAANFLVLMAFWFAVIRIVRWVRGSKSEDDTRPT